ncbi:MAG: hypothetical protein GAK38_00792 [Xylophilus sp.]|nr:MAG: hypothetical protein GAK38_00792 [Xylophilus sp.]
MAGPVGAVWFEPRPFRTVRLHVAIDPAFHGRWVTPRTLRFLAASARATGAIGVWAEPLPEHAPLVRRLGFQEAGSHHYLPLYVQSKDDDGAAHAA